MMRRAFVIFYLLLLAVFISCEPKEGGVQYRNIFIFDGNNWIEAHGASITLSQSISEQDLITLSSGKKGLFFRPSKGSSGIINNRNECSFGNMKITIMNDRRPWEEYKTISDRLEDGHTQTIHFSLVNSGVINEEVQICVPYKNGYAATVSIKR